MKYCEKCGTQLSDDTVVCPQCHPNIKDRHTQTPSPSTPTKNAVNKNNPLILTNFIISSLTLIAVIIMYFNLPSISNSIGSNDNSNSNSNNITNSACPANEYGNHNWSKATCQEPSYCYDCYEEKNDKLGSHSWDIDEHGNRYCWDCGMLYDDYVNSEK